MNKEYQIKLGAKIDDSTKSIKDINKQIKDLQQKLDKIVIKYDISNVSTKKLKSEIQSITNETKKMKSELNGVGQNKSTSISKGFQDLDSALKSVNLTTDKFKKNFKQLGNSITNGAITTTKYVNSENQILSTTERLNGETKSYSVTLETLNQQFAKNVQRIDSLNRSFKTKEQTLKSLNVDLKEYYQISSKTDDLGTYTERYSNNAGKIVTLTKKMVNGQQDWSASLKEVNVAVGANAREADKWKYSWTKAFQSFTTYMSVTTVFYTIARGIKNMISEVVSLDSALTELKKVTDLEGKSLDNFVKEAYEAASTVGKTGRDMIEAATEFAKAGYDESQIKELGRLALMYTNIADEELNAAQASEFMIAQMKAFNIEASNAESVLDMVNEV